MYLFAAAIGFGLAVSGLPFWLFPWVGVRKVHFAIQAVVLSFSGARFLPSWGVAELLAARLAVPGCVFYRSAMSLCMLPARAENPYKTNIIQRCPPTLASILLSHSACDSSCCLQRFVCVGVASFFTSSRAFHFSCSFSCCLADRGFSGERLCVAT